MRVAIVQEHIAVARGGAETSTFEMARRLGELGLEVSIVHRLATSAPPSDPLVRFLPVPVRAVTRAGQTFQFVQGAQRLCREQRFDIVHAVTPCLCANVYQPRGGTYAETISRSTAMCGPWLRAVKRIGRRFNVRQQFLRRMEETLLRKYGGCVFVAALSEYVRRQVLSLAASQFPAERVRVVFNGVEAGAVRGEERPGLRSELGLEDARRVVLFVAHNFKLKGLRELLRETAAGRSDWVVVVAGRGDSRPYERLAHRLGVAQRVRFAGTSTPVASWYATADVLAHPTWYDPCSRVVLEALSLGLPVVTTRYNGAAEIMEPGRHGVVLDEPDDISGLAGGIETCLQHAVRTACQADAPRMSAQLSMARHARELKALYEGVLAAR